MFQSVIKYVIVAGATPESNALFGQGSGPIFLDDLACTSLETRLIDCTHGGIEVTNCVHSSDAGVRCIAAGNLLAITLPKMNDCHSVIMYIMLILGCIFYIFK